VNLPPKAMKQNNFIILKILSSCMVQWFMPEISASLEVEIRKIKVQAQVQSRKKN
jgi:hypothetical protein